MDVVEVNCFGTDKFVLLSNRKVKVFNEKTGRWQTYDMIEYHDNCPVCGKAMLVRAIPGTTWLACCSEECYRKYFMGRLVIVQTKLPEDVLIELKKKTKEETTKEALAKAIYHYLECKYTEITTETTSPKEVKKRAGRIPVYLHEIIKTKNGKA